MVYSFTKFTHTEYARLLQHNTQRTLILHTARGQAGRTGSPCGFITKRFEHLSSCTPERCKRRYKAQRNQD